MFVGAALAVQSDGEERHVPTQYTTIGAAIYACNDGDVVIVHPGTYTGTNNRDISFRGKAITVRSIDPDDAAIVEATVVDCQGSGAFPHRGFYFTNSETRGAVLAGLSITHGYLNPGSALFCANSSPTIYKCRIVDCAGPDAPFSSTAGSPLLDGCYFGNNFGTAYSAITLSGGMPLVIRCTIVGNVGGPAIGAYGTTLTLWESIVAGHWAASGTLGGGMILDGASAASVVDCVFSDNRTVSYGGGIQVSPQATLSVAGCSFAGNSAYSGGALRIDGVAVISNCVLWGNSGFPGYGHELALEGNSITTVTYSDVQGGEADVYSKWSATLNWGAGNIDADPLFVDPDGPDNDPLTWADNDYRLAAFSPCIDAGDNAIVPADSFDLDDDGNVNEPLPVDIDGAPRIVDDPAVPDTGNGTPPIVDMGAYERQPAAACNPCDANCDGSVNGQDIQPFRDLLLGASPCSPCAADTNGDGSVNGFDITGFVECLSG